ncbi:MAG: SDR family oxidoreductase [Burkholderiales bacterium]|nr:SDR family oxidoreductase [Burkholderiales bacterium]
MATVFDRFRLDGRRALVTGGSRGLGLEIAQALHDAGARVALLARRTAWFDEARVAIPDAVCVQGDVAVQADVQRAVAETVMLLGGPVDILVNGAGISWAAPAEAMPADKFVHVTAVNYFGAFWASQAVAPGMMAQRWGKIVNVASVAGLKGERPETLDAVGYSGSKAALIGLTRDLAVKWGPHGIRVNAIAPGFFPTRLTEQVIPRVTAALETHHPLRRAGRPGELGGAALLLASPAGDYINGHTLVVDGGVMAGG